LIRFYSILGANAWKLFDLDVAEMRKEMGFEK
jgi:hypothetical protein